MHTSVNMEIIVASVNVKISHSLFTMKAALAKSAWPLPLTREETTALTHLHAACADVAFHFLFPTSIS